MKLSRKHQLPRNHAFSTVGTRGWARKATQLWTVRTVVERICEITEFEVGLDIAGVSEAARSIPR